MATGSSTGRMATGSSIRSAAPCRILRQRLAGSPSPPTAGLPMRSIRAAPSFPVTRCAVTENFRYWATALPPRPPGPLDNAFTLNGHFLYDVTSGGSIIGYQVQADGSLISLNLNLTVPAG